MRFRGGEFSSGTTGNFQPELTVVPTLYNSYGLQGAAEQCTLAIGAFL
jgi:hypothetical protein